VSAIIEGVPVPVPARSLAERFEGGDDRVDRTSSTAREVDGDRSVVAPPRAALTAS
jgi:hypothetical protein